MIRYDPTESNHKEYEIVPAKSEANAKKVKTKKKAKDIVEDVETEQVEVSKDVYFSVSESLSKSLKEGGQFSLLKTYGKEENIEKGLSLCALHLKTFYYDCYSYIIYIF